MYTPTRPLSSGDIADIVPIHWDPPGGYALAVEVMAVSELRRRGSIEHFKRLQRQHFHLLLACTSGQCQPMVDFVSLTCRKRSWLILKPGQLHRFDFSKAWDGWVIVFRPELLLPQRRETLPMVNAIASQISTLDDHLVLPARANTVCLQLVRQMLSDARLPVGTAERNALLQQQIYLLLLRLAISAPSTSSNSCVAAIALERAQRFKQILEANYKQQHQVKYYAKLLACTEKTLTRAALALTGLSAKALLIQRITLEAKRLLAHTSVSVKEIAYELGFDESGNFVKFFKKEVGTSPLNFRREYVPDVV